MNGPGRRDRPGINARAMQTKSAKGTEQLSEGNHIVDVESLLFGVRTLRHCQSSATRFARRRSQSAPSTGFIFIARALIPGRSLTADPFIDRHIRCPGECSVIPQVALQHSLSPGVLRALTHSSLVATFAERRPVDLCQINFSTTTIHQFSLDRAATAQNRRRPSRDSGAGLHGYSSSNG